MKDLHNTVERIENLIKLSAMSTNAALKAAKVKPFVMDNMKRGRMPSTETLCGLADYFNVSVDYLLGRETASVNVGRDNNGFIGEANAPISMGESLSAQERDLLQIFRNASGRKQIEIMQFMYGLEENK